jgi:hypothetical protein
VVRVCCDELVDQVALRPHDLQFHSLEVSTDSRLRHVLCPCGWHGAMCACICVMLLVCTNIIMLCRDGHTHICRHTHTRMLSAHLHAYTNVNGSFMLRNRVQNHELSGSAVMQCHLGWCMSL